MSARWENGRKQTYLPPACLRYSPNLDDHRMHQPRAGLLRVRARSERHDDLPPPAHVQWSRAPDARHREQLRQVLPGQVGR